MSAVPAVRSVSILNISWGRARGDGGLRAEVACPEKEVCTTYNIQADIRRQHINN